MRNFRIPPRRFGHLLLTGLVLAGLTGTAGAVPRAVPTPATRIPDLTRLSSELEARTRAQWTAQYHRLLAETSGPQAVLNRSEDLLLVGVVQGRPRYRLTTNLFAARSIGTDRLWPGGSTGLGLTGANLAGELAIWDGGQVMISHQEFGGRVTLRDASPSINYHATHVAGTLVAAGVVPLAMGMSPAATLESYDWILDEAEMAAAAAAGLLVSNHSYTGLAGWLYRGGAVPWYWYGDPALSDVEDPGFGLYDQESQAWDEIAFNAPDYLIVKAAGNDRDDYGPAAGGEHYVWNAGLAGWVLSTTTRLPDGGLDGYDSIPYNSVAKNILTVGAVFDVDGGWTQPADVVNSGFGGWGPTDDGRIKPDLVANGLGLYSCYIDSNSSYIGLSGTSMAAPNAAGTLHLLAQLWRDTHGGQTAHAATLKGIALHTAHEAGTAAGPDYAFGWGLFNAVGAAEVITGDVAFAGRAVESVLAGGATDTLVLWSEGIEPVVTTISWTDPAASPSAWSLDPVDLKLVNDLDLRLERIADTATFLPWILDPANPAAAAVTGDNFRDNVEKVEIGAPLAGAYRLLVSHKGVLQGGLQAYSLITSGLGGASAEPIVTNVAFSQRRDGSGLVDVTFDLEDPDSPQVAVDLAASSDGGATWNLAVTTASGDLGPAVTVGPARTITWAFAQDHPGTFLPAVMIRITASEPGGTVAGAEGNAAGKNNSTSSTYSR